MSRVVGRRVGTTRGHTGQGPTDVFALVLEARDLSAEVWNYGATLVGVQVPEGTGFDLREPRRLGDVVDPDSPNQPALGSATLRPGDTYRHLTRHSFAVR